MGGGPVTVLPSASDLDEFNDGFADGIAGRPRAKRRTGTYRRAWQRGMEAAQRDAEFRAGPLEIPDEPRRVARRRA